MEELDYIFSQITKEEHFEDVRENFEELGIDIFYRPKSGGIKIKSLNTLFQELSEKLEEDRYV